MASNQRGLFLVVEGIDGSGKSTFTGNLVRALRELEPHREILSLQEPGRSPAGLRIRELLTSSRSPSHDEWVELFFEDRKEDVEKNILPALQRGAVVILDRYAWSTAAYQGGLPGGKSPEELLNENWKRGFPQPDLLIYLNLSPRKAMDRLKQRAKGGELDHFETEEKLTRIHSNFQKTLPEKGILVLDATESEGDLCNRALVEIKPLLKDGNVTGRERD